MIQILLRSALIIITKSKVFLLSFQIWYFEVKFVGVFHRLGARIRNKAEELQLFICFFYQFLGFTYVHGKIMMIIGIWSDQPGK